MFILLAYRTGRMKSFVFFLLFYPRGLKIYAGSGFKEQSTTKQLSNSIWANRKVETKLFSGLIVCVIAPRPYRYYELIVLFFVSTKTSIYLIYASHICT